MRKILNFVVVIVVICMGSGCSNQDDIKNNESNFVLGFSQLGSESGWRIGNTKSIKSAASLFDVDLIYLNAEQKQENQIAHIRRLIANQVDVLAFSPIITTGWDNVLNEAKEASIPVIITDRSIITDDESLYVTFIGSDFKKEGSRAGEFLIQYFEREKSDKKNVSIIEIRGTEFSTPALGRTDGFEHVVGINEKFEIIYSADGDFINSKGKEIIREIIQKGIVFDVIYSHNDAMTYGAIEALEEAGIKPGIDVVIISVDGEQKSIDLLKEGKINCVVECTPMIGNKLMEVSQLILSGGKVPKSIFSEETVFTMWDDLELLEARGY